MALRISRIENFLFRIRVNQRYPRLEFSSGPTPEIVVPETTEGTWCGRGLERAEKTVRTIGTGRPQQRYNSFGLAGMCTLTQRTSFDSQRWAA